MKKFITLIMAMMLMVSIASCKSEKPVESSKTTGKETVITEEVIEETITVENIITEHIEMENIETEDIEVENEEPEIWISEEYLKELEFNSQKNRW